MKKILQGLGVSPGKVQAKIRHVQSFKEYTSFQEGEILVTKITDPTMVPMMNKAGGIICDIGGLTSHPSIVSRELGIPCIVSAKDKHGTPATTVLKEKILVEMDGTTGEVFLLDEKKKNEKKTMD